MVKVSEVISVIRSDDAGRQTVLQSKGTHAANIRVPLCMAQTLVPLRYLNMVAAEHGCSNL